MLLIAKCLLAGCLATGQAEGPAAAQADLAPAVERLVRQLDAREKSQRDGAEDQLLKLGTRALALLPAPDNGTAEVKNRLGRVRVALEKQRAEEEIRASRITLSGQNMPLAEAIAAVQQQTGNKIVDFRQQFGQEPNDVFLKLDYDRAEFWPTLDQILDQASMTTYPFSGEPGLAIVLRSGSQSPRYKRGYYAGAFRFETAEITARRDPRETTGDSLKLQLEVAWEPRLTPIAISQPGDAVTALLDDQQSLSINTDSELEVSINAGDWATQIPLVFPLPSRKATKIDSLKGKLSVMLPGPVETFRFEKLVGGSKGEQRRAGVRVILEQARQNNLVWEVRVRVVFDNAGKALESHRTWVLQNEADLETAAKERVAFAGLETTRQAENEVGVAYLFDVPDLAGATFVYKTPTVLIDATVDYELRDIKLP